MTEAIKPKGTIRFDVYTFSGIWQYSKGIRTGVLKTISLKECLADVFADRRLSQFFDERFFHFDVRSPDIDDIYMWLEQGTVIFPFSVNVKKEDVLLYIDKGFTVMFMKPKEFREMQKALKNFR